MIWIAPSEKDNNNAALEKRLWDAAEQAVPALHFAETDFNSAGPQGLLDLISLRFDEVRFTAIVAPSFRLIYKLYLQIQNLHRTHDLLLPRPLSGLADLL